MATFLALLILTGFSCLIAAYIHEGRHSQHKRLKGEWAVGNAAQSGYECVEPGGPCPASPQRKRREHFYKLPKSGGVPYTPAFDIAPFHRKGSNQRMTRGMATQRRHNDQTTTWVTGHTKRGFPSPSQEDAFTPQRGLMELSRPWSAAAIRISAHLKGGWGTRLKVLRRFVVLIGL